MARGKSCRRELIGNVQYHVMAVSRDAWVSIFAKRTIIITLLYTQFRYLVHAPQLPFPYCLQTQADRYRAGLV
jgi:hypothetical protein